METVFIKEARQFLDDTMLSHLKAVQDNSTILQFTLVFHGETEN